jgi:hypothetical protein
MTRSLLIAVGAFLLLFGASYGVLVLASGLIRGDWSP